jgi:signal peptidase I
MTHSNLSRMSREVLLTVGAILGVLCIAATVAGVGFGIKPLVFRSGSMSPAIHTGDLGVAQTVEASSVQAGDIVSVIDAGGSRVTHRVVNIAEQGDSRQLTLRGDANQKPDAEVYTATEVERVLFHIPKAGYVVNAATGPIGIFVLGLYVAGMLTLVLRKDRPHDGPGTGAPSTEVRGGARKAARHPHRARAMSRSAAVVAVGASIMVAAPAVAVPTPWTNPVEVTGSTFTAFSVAAPTGALTCTKGGLFNRTVVMSWAAVGSPATTAQRYKIVITRDSSATPVYLSRVISTASFTIDKDELDLPNYVTFRVRVYGSAPDGSWQTTTNVSDTMTTLSASIFC